MHIHPPQASARLQRVLKQFDRRSSTVSIRVKQINLQYVYICTIVVHINYKAMLVISSREFRQNQKMYFERADKGEQIIVQRGKDKAYALTPIGEEDLYFNAEMVDRIKESIKQVESGKSKKIANSQEINELLGL